MNAPILDREDGRMDFAARTATGTRHPPTSAAKTSPLFIESSLARHTVGRFAVAFESIDEPAHSSSYLTSPQYQRPHRHEASTCQRFVRRH